MKSVTYAKTPFERECGPDVVFVKAEFTDRGLEFRFRLAKTGREHIIASTPNSSGRAAIEQAATTAGRWARTMAERSAA